MRTVGKALRDIGIPTEPTPKGFPADLLAKGRIAVEVTGIVDKLTADTPKVGQLMRFKEKFYSGEKLVLIVNTY